MAILFKFGKLSSAMLPVAAFFFGAAGISADRMSWPNAGTAGGELQITDLVDVTVSATGGPAGSAYVRFTGSNRYIGTSNVGISGSQARTLLTIYRAPQNQGIWGWGLGANGQLFDCYTFRDYTSASTPGHIRHLYGNEDYLPPAGYQAPPAWSAALERYTAPDASSTVTIDSWAGGQRRTTTRPASQVQTADGPLRLGQDGVFLATQVRDIALVIIWNYALSAAQIQAVREYVSARFGLIC